jgi:hypothetical protein
MQETTPIDENTTNSKHNKVVKCGEVESSYPMGVASSRLATWNKEPPQLNKDQTSINSSHSHHNVTNLCHPSPQKTKCNHIQYE